MGLAEQGSPAERPYVLVRAAEAATRDLRNGRGRSLRLLEPDMADGASSVSRVVIDPGTCAIRLHRYLVVEDCGVVINPMVVDGQVRGGVTQGAWA